MNKIKLTSENNHVMLFEEFINELNDNLPLTKKEYQMAEKIRKNYEHKKFIIKKCKDIINPNVKFKEFTEKYFEYKEYFDVLIGSFFKYIINNNYPNLNKNFIKIFPKVINDLDIIINEKDISEYGDLESWFERHGRIQYVTNVLIGLFNDYIDDPKKTIQLRKISVAARHGFDEKYIYSNISFFKNKKEKDLYFKLATEEGKSFITKTNFSKLFPEEYEKNRKFW